MEKKKILVGMHNGVDVGIVKYQLEKRGLEVTGCGILDCVMENLSNNKYEMVYMDVNLEFSKIDYIEPVLKVRNYIKNNNLETELIGTTGCFSAKNSAEEEEITLMDFEMLFNYVDQKYCNQ